MFDYGNFSFILKIVWTFIYLRSKSYTSIQNIKYLNITKWPFGWKLSFKLDMNFNCSSEGKIGKYCIVCTTCSRNLLVCGRFEGDSSDFTLVGVDNKILWYGSLREVETGENQKECHILYHRQEEIPLKEVPTWTSKPEDSAQRLHHDFHVTTTLKFWKI